MSGTVQIASGSSLTRNSTNARDGSVPRLDGVSMVRRNLRETSLDLLPEKVRPVHTGADGGRVALVGAALAAWVPRGRPRQRGGEHRRLLLAEIRRGLAEVRLRGRAHAVDAGAELDHVQVELEDAALG